MDQCKFCKCKENLKECESAECTQHESWYASEMHKKGWDDGIRHAIKELKNADILNFDKKAVK
jgi:hypothetical protein